MDFRTIRDNQIDTEELAETMNEAYELAMSNSIFNEENNQLD
jgi:hypothetical protein